jgi:hypothetical protein
MSPQNEDTLAALRDAARARGAGYRTARERLLAGGEWLDSALRDPSRLETWPLRRLAEALRLWRADSGLCESVARTAAGAVSRGPGTPVGGRVAPWDRAQEIVRLGATALPRVIELLWLERDWADDAELSALLTAVFLFGDLRALAPVAALLEGLRGHPGEQALCAETLGRLGHPAAEPPLLRLLADRTAGREPRREAARWLGLLGSGEAVASLQRVFLDTAEPMLLRADAAVALGRLGGDLAATTLVAHLDLERSSSLVQRMIEGLGHTGSPLALPDLRRLAGAHPDPFVRQEAATVAERLGQRLAGRQPRPFEWGS